MMFHYSDQQPPYALPQMQGISGIKTRTMSSKNSSDANEIRFDDNPGNENVYLQAQNTLHINVKGNENQQISGNYDVHIKGDYTQTIGYTSTFTSPQSITLKAGTSEIHITPNMIQVKGATINMG